ncbi:MAG TPA: ribosome silencing factor [bacterium]
MGSEPGRRRVFVITSQELAYLAAGAALDKQAEDPVVLDVRALSTVADFFVVCTADSGPQLEACRDAIDQALRVQGCRIWHTEGDAAPGGPAGGTPPLRWILMDCGDVIVHLMDQTTRGFYQLERLWGDAPRLPLPGGGSTPASPAPSSQLPLREG